VSLLLVLASCVSQPITPEVLRELGDDGAAAAARLERAVEIANDFLASDARETLPPGRIERRAGELVFVHAGETVFAHAGEPPEPSELTWIKIRRTTFGDLVESFGFEAQERSDGFVVGKRGDGDPRLANSLFVSPFDGSWNQAPWIAELILHELTHTVMGDGTTSVCGAVSYYAEAIFLWRYDDHSAERRPYATSAEFRAWAAGKAPQSGP